MRTTKETSRYLSDAMTVADLIERLQELDPHAIPLFVCDYGDYCHTQQAFPICHVDPMYDDSDCLRESAYSHSGLAIDPIDDDTPDADGDSLSVVLLQA